MLAAGTRLGPHRILALLGAGGMGEVYRARDTRLDRDVAIKALPEAFSKDPERLARFEREAKLLASLSHANIAAIHGLEEAAGQRYLILEFIEGEALQARLTRGPLPLRDALDACRQIATALEVAHESGVVHRDLKPGNVMLTPTGDVKVLDFGLARGGAGSGSSPDPGLSASPTLALAATAAGVLLGTAAYMSPEQARGRSVDKRTDIWTFGCVLLECLTGRQAFAGETISDPIARILERAPDLGALPARTPPRVRDLLQRCLQKDARERLRDIGDARLELERAIEELESGAEPVGMGAPRGAGASARLAWSVAALALLVAALAVVLPRIKAVTKPAPVRFFIAPPPGGHALSDFAAGQAAISPDGRFVAFPALDSTGTFHLWVRCIDELAPRMVPGTDNGTMPVWSPDGRYLAFNVDGKLKRTGVDGGDVETLCTAPAMRGGAWSGDGTIVFAPAPDGPLFKVSANGGAPVAVTALDSTRLETAHRYPTFLADGRHFLFVALPPRLGRYTILMGSVDGMKPKKILEADGGAIYAAPGWIICPRGTGLMAQRFDSRALKLEGEPLALADSPERSNHVGNPGVSASGNGALGYVRWTAPNNELAWYGLDGRLLGKVPVAPGPYINVVPSPDGLHFAAERWVTAERIELWQLDGVRGLATRVCDVPGVNDGARWSPDGRVIMYASNRNGPVSFHMVDAFGAGPEETVYEAPGTLKNLKTWPANHDGVLFEQFDAVTGGDLWWLPLHGDRKPVPMVRTPGNDGNTADVSPDGEWLLYDSDVTGRRELYVRPFAGGREVQVTTSGSWWGFWRKHGREVLCVSLDNRTVTAIPFEPGSPPHVGAPHLLFTAPEGSCSLWYNPSGDRFLIVSPAKRREPSGVAVLLNWTAALEKP